MKKSISIWSFPDKTVKESMKLAKETGFDGIELALNETGECSLDATESEWADIKAYAKELDLALPSVATGLYWSYPFTSDDLVIREKGIKVAEKQLEMAKALGADSVLIVPGAVDVVFSPGFSVVPYDIAYDRALSALMQLKPKAEALQVHIGVENVWNMFLLSPLEFRDFVDKIDSPYVGVYFDVGNVLSSGYPEHWIRILGKRIRKVHFKDYRKGADAQGFVGLLEGHVNWTEVMSAFKEIGYDDWATAEMFPVNDLHGKMLIQNTKNAMDLIMEAI